VDGTHIKANASKHKGVRYDRAGELEKQLRRDVRKLLEQAEASDRADRPDDQRLPDEIARRERLREKMLEARRQLEQRAADEAQERRRDSGEGGVGGGSQIRPKDSQQINLTDPDSALMRKSRRDSYEQAYNAQVVVDSDGSQLVLATDVIRTPSDANQLEPALARVPKSIGKVKRMLADAGYMNAESFERVQQKVDLYVALGDNRHRRYDYRPARKRAPKKFTDPRLLVMRKKLATQEGRLIYGKRASTVEPVFGVIKATMGLRQFLLRGLGKVRIEWDLVCLAYNMRRLWTLAAT
jgi:hypothetical protein